ncbi:MAG: putative alpha/beta-hydrolase family hydrolase [Parasphingorhabdus sp.]
MSLVKELSFEVPLMGSVSAILNQPDEALGLYVLGHGDGSNIHIPFLVELSKALENRSVATLRFEYPYSDKQDFVPFTDMPTDPDVILIETVRSALNRATQLAPETPLFVGGHSLSARMATEADAKDSLPAKAIISLGFPRKGDPSRTTHLDRTTLPILFIQGTKDSLGTKDEIRDMANTLGKRATVKWINGATHGFKVEGAEDCDVIYEIAKIISDYIVTKAYL